MRLRSNAPGTGSEDAQAELVISQLDEIRRTLDPDSKIRHLVLNGRTRAVSRRLYVEDVTAELERLGT